MAVKSDWIQNENLMVFVSDALVYMPSQVTIIYLALEKI